MIEFEIQKCENMFHIINTFFAQYTLNNSKFCITPMRDRLKRDYENELYTNHVTLPYGTSNISYKIDGININFIIKYIKIGVPVGLDCDSHQHEELYLSIDNTIYPNYREIIDILFNDSRGYYETHIKNKKHTQEKVTCYIWDDFWDAIYKRKKRPLKTVHLNEKADEVLGDMRDFLSEKTEKEYDMLGLPYKRNYLFEGYPGTGKTSLISSLASE